MTYYMKGFRAAQAKYEAQEAPEFYDDDPPDCYECDGKGKCEYYIDDTYTVTEERECEVCGGTGKLPPSEPVYD